MGRRKKALTSNECNTIRETIKEQVKDLEPAERKEARKEGNEALKQLGCPIRQRK